MTRIDFYQLKSGRFNREALLCQLCAKAVQSEQSVLILCSSELQLQSLDRQLWTFQDDSFVPHDSTKSDEFFTPILLQTEASPKGDRDVLINLCEHIPEYFAQFDRLLEIVAEDNRESSRQHYGFYQERGYALQHHSV